MKFTSDTINKIATKGNALLKINKSRQIDLINEKACELLNLDHENTIFKDINHVIPNNHLTQVLDTGIPEVHKHITYLNRNLIVTILPLHESNIVDSVLAIFYDNTDNDTLSQRVYEDEVYINILHTILDTFNERIVVVDQDSNIIMMSKAYKEFLGIDKPEGKHVTEVIENTRMHIVVQNEEMEVGDIHQIKDSKMIAMRIPLKKDGKVIGAVGKIMFKDISDLTTLSNKVRLLEKEIEYYKNELSNNRVAIYSFNHMKRVLLQVLRRVVRKASLK